MDGPATRNTIGWIIGPQGPMLAPLRMLKPAFAALRHRDYCLIWFGSLLSDVGGWMQTVAKSWLVYELTGSAFWLGVDAFVQRIASLVILPLSGTLADRLNRRTMLIVCNVLLATIATLLACLSWTQTLAVWHLITASVLMGTVQAFVMPATQSLLPTLVGREDLPNAIALNSLQFNLARLAGPALGGVTLLALGAGWSFMVNAATYFFLIAALLVMRTQVKATEAGSSILQSLAEGARYLRRRADLLAFMSLITLNSFMMAPAMTMLPALVQQAYKMDASAYSLMLSFYGGGAVLGAILLASRTRLGPRPWRAIPSMLLLSVMLLAIGYGSYAVALGAILVAGMCMIGAMNRLQAACIGSVPDAMRGRISSYHKICVRAGVPLGALLAGVLGTWIGIDRVFRLYGVLLLTGVLAIALVVRVRHITLRDESDFVAFEANDDYQR